jgi:hypothetical protein
VGFGLGCGKAWFFLKPFGDDLVWCSSVENALPPRIVGSVEAAKQLLEVMMRIDSDAEHLAADAAVEALNHTIRLWGARTCMTVGCPELGTGPLEGRREAATVIGQHVGDPEGKGGGSLVQKGDGTPLGFIVLDGEMH